MEATNRRPPFPRPNVRLLVLLCSIVSLGAFLWVALVALAGKSPSQISVLQYGVVVLVGLLYFGWAWKLAASSFSPLLFSLLYFCGYVVSLLAMEIDIRPYVSNWDQVNEVGYFSFTSNDYWRVIAAACLGMAGIAVGQACASWLSGRPHAAADRVIAPATLKRSVLLWAIGSLLVAVVTGYLGIAVMTARMVILPYKLAGILHGLRYYLLPLIGLYLFGECLAQRERKTVLAILLCNLVLVCIIVPTTLSKSAGFNLLLPYIALLILYPALRGVVSLKTTTLVAVGILSASVIIVSVGYLRDISAFTGDPVTLSDVRETPFDPEAVIGQDGVVYDLLQKSVLRVLGATGLMAVESASPMPSVTAFLRVDGTDPDLTATALKRAFNYTMNEEGYIEGKGFGLFAFLFLSHSYLVILCGAAFYAGVLLFLERLAREKGNLALGAGVAFYGAVAVWEGSFELHLKFVLAVITALLWIRLVSRRRAPVHGIKRVETLAPGKGLEPVPQR